MCLGANSLQRNLSMGYGQPTTKLEPIPALERILNDINRPYKRNVTHLHGWQFFMLADHLEQLILCSRLRADGTRPGGHPKKKYKVDHYHHLYFCLK